MIRVAPIVGHVDVDADPVVPHVAVTAREPCQPRRALHAVDRDVQMIAIVSDLDARRRRGYRAVERERLQERVARRDRPPHGIIELAIDLRRDRDAHRGDGGEEQGEHPHDRGQTNHYHPGGSRCSPKRGRLREPRGGVIDRATSAGTSRTLPSKNATL